MALVLGVGFLFVVSLVASAVLTAVSEIVGDILPIDAATAHILDLVVSFAFLTLLFAIIYEFVPDVRIAWSDVWIGTATPHCYFRSENLSSVFIWAIARHIHLMVRPVHSLLFCYRSTIHLSCFLWRRV